MVGHGGAYVKHIQSESGCRVQIKGRGSGYTERETGQESDEPMFLHVAYVPPFRERSLPNVRIAVPIPPKSPKPKSSAKTSSPTSSSSTKASRIAARGTTDTIRAAAATAAGTAIETTTGAAGTGPRAMEGATAAKAVPTIPCHPPAVRPGSQTRQTATSDPHPLHHRALRHSHPTPDVFCAYSLSCRALPVPTMPAG